MNIYIHVPFCQAKCAYCAFYSVENASEELIRQYLAKLDLDLSKISPEVVAETLFLGGGTPNLLSDKLFAELIDILQNRLQLTPDAEVTLECNPTSLTREKLIIAKNLVNRLSIGVQSFKPRLRQILGRAGENEQIFQALKWAKELNFPQVGIDLIYNIPTQSLKDWNDDLEIARQLEIDHLSCYALTSEEGAKLSDWPLSDEIADQMWSIIPQTSSFERYEVSNYARSGHYCRHNQNVWRGGKLLGFGPGAASFDGIDRFSEVANLGQWLAGAPREVDRIADDSRRREIFAVNLRTVTGWSEEAGVEFFGKTEFQKLTESAREISIQFPDSFDFVSGVRLTEKGLRFWDEIAMEII